MVLLMFYRQFGLNYREFDNRQKPDYTSEIKGLRPVFAPAKGQIDPLKNTQVGDRPSSFLSGGTHHWDHFRP